MKKNLPGVFANKIESDISNNKKVYYSFDDKQNIDNRIPSLIGQNINQKLNTIFNSPNYVSKVTVRIFLANECIVKKIVGRNKNYLITIDNELIPISEIIDIEYVK